MSDVRTEDSPPTSGVPGGPSATLRRWLRTPDFWVLLLPFFYYVALIRTEITFGDGPELLVAMYNLGGPHPSGYPLFTMLGIIPSHIPWPSGFWSVAAA